MYRWFLLYRWGGSPEERTDRIPWGPGEPRRRFCFLLSPRTKGSGRALDSFFARIAFFMRGQTMKPFFYMRSCRAAPPFLTSRKGGKKRQGAKPPESPGGLPTFFSGKSAGGRTPEPAHTMREPRGPRGPVERGTETIQWPKSPGPQPLFLSSVFMIPPGRFS